MLRTHPVQSDKHQKGSAMAYRILTLSPGSTSTKVAVFEGAEPVFKANVTTAWPPSSASSTPPA